MKQDLRNNPNIKLGNVDIEDLEAEAKSIKVRVNTMIDGDIVDELKARSAEAGGKYQTLMNKLLRDALFGNATVKEISFDEESLRKLAKLVQPFIHPTVDRNLVASSKKKAKTTGTKKHYR